MQQTAPEDLATFSAMYNDEAFERDLDIIIKGFSAVYGLAISEQPGLRRR